MYARHSQIFIYQQIVVNSGNLIIVGLFVHGKKLPTVERGLPTNIIVSLFACGEKMNAHYYNLLIKNVNKSSSNTRFALGLCAMGATGHLVEHIKVAAHLGALRACDAFGRRIGLLEAQQCIFLAAGVWSAVHFF